MEAHLPSRPSEVPAGFLLVWGGWRMPIHSARRKKAKHATFC